MNSIRSILKAERWNLRNGSAAKATLLVALVLICVAYSHYGHSVLPLDGAYTHLFYMPVMLAYLWWGRRAAWGAVFLGGVLFACHALSRAGAWNATQTPEFLLAAPVSVFGVVAGSLKSDQAPDERKKAEQDLRRSNAILEAVTLAAERLLKAAKWEQNIGEVLDLLGLAAKASRVCLFKNRLGDDGAILTNRLFAWAAPGLTQSSDSTECEDFPLADGGFARWQETLSGGSVVHGRVKDFPSSEQKALTGRRVKSIVVVPIFAEQEWWGFIAFGDCLAERERSLLEIGALEAVGRTLGAIIQRSQVEERRARSEAELLQARKMEAIGQLAGRVAHDFNNVVTAIRGYADLVLMTLDEKHPAHQDILEVRSGSIRAADLTRQLLLFSRRQPMLMGPLDANQIIQELCRAPERLVGEDIGLATELAPDLWTIDGNARTIEQAIRNLVLNSRDAMPEGGRITVKSENSQVDEEYCRVCSDARPGKFVCLSVSDTGVGIDPAIRQRIFEPYFTTKEPETGAGMGLPVVYGIVKQHAGWIDLTSSPGRGATFSIFIPAAPTVEFDEEDVSRVLETLRGEGERILLVEDEEHVRRLTDRGLTECGYVVYPAEDAQEALDVFEREDGKFDLILSDVGLPGESGARLVGRLLKSRPGISVLFASGYSTRQSDWALIHELGYPALQKPFSLVDLLQAVRRVLDEG